MKPLVYVVDGLGIGCQNEVAKSYELAGADVQFVLFRELLSKGRRFLFKSKVLNFPGGFLHGDNLGAGMCAGNDLEQSGIKDLLIEYAEHGNVIYGQCNGIQVLVRTGLLPGLGGDYTRQTVTLANNKCGIYRVAPVLHMVEQGREPHFAFKGLEGEPFYIWCRHGEGKLQFYSPTGLITEEEAQKTRELTNASHVLLRYVDPTTGKPTEDFPHNPNGSIDAIAGLVNDNGNIFGHMGHTEVGIYASRDPRWFADKDALRRMGIKAADLEGKRLEGHTLQVYRNIVEHVKQT